VRISKARGLSSSSNVIARAVAPQTAVLLGRDHPEERFNPAIAYERGSRFSARLSARQPKTARQGDSLSGAAEAGASAA
jgi:hypothetical protein